MKPDCRHRKHEARFYLYAPRVEDEAKKLNVEHSPSISPDVEKLKDKFSLKK